MLLYELAFFVRRLGMRRSLRERNVATAVSLAMLMLAIYAGTIVLWFVSLSLR